jgi:hypothetical protein
MRRFVLGWKRLGHEGRLRAYIVNYADDFVICCRGTAAPAMAAMREMMQGLRLTVNEDKTRRCRVWDESFEFLGYTIGRCYSPKTGKVYIGTKPSKQRISRLCGEISELTKRRWGFIDTKDQVGRINRKLGHLRLRSRCARVKFRFLKRRVWHVARGASLVVATTCHLPYATCARRAHMLAGRRRASLEGWSNYFRLGPVSNAYRAVDRHTAHRLREWLRKKHKVQGRGTARYPDEYLYQKLNLIRLAVRTRNFTWAKA